MEDRGPLGVLDFGSNSTRYILHRDEADGFQPGFLVDRGMEITRLSEGMEGHSVISEAAEKRLLECLEEFDRARTQVGGRWGRAVATSAFRRADNAGEVRANVRNLLELEKFDILTGDQEARLTAGGAIRSLGVESGSVVDIGGSSTELVIVDDSGTMTLESLPVGVVRLLEQVDSPKRWEKSVYRRIREIVREFLAENGVVRQLVEPLIVVGGTGTTLGSIKLELDEYDSERVHGFNGELKDVKQFLTDWFETPFEQIRRQEPMVVRGREDVLFPGLVLLEELLNWTSVRRFVVSDFGLLAGVMEEELSG